jgi:uncharacterized membrane protein YcgQ (UPF0703/DUF1980 family)
LTPKVEHWYWDSWVLLALSATTCFCAANFIISTLSHYGMASIMYFNLGSVIYAIIYFVIQARRSHQNRVLLHTDGKFDFSLASCYLGGACFGFSIFFAISTTFKYCTLAGLNIGIA